MLTFSVTRISLVGLLTISCRGTVSHFKTYTIKGPRESFRMSLALDDVVKVNGCFRGAIQETIPLGFGYVIRLHHFG